MEVQVSRNEIRERGKEARISHGMASCVAKGRARAERFGIIFTLFALPAVALAGHENSMRLFVDGSDSVEIDVNDLPTVLSVEVVVDSIAKDVSAWQGGLVSSVPGVFEITSQTLSLITQWEVKSAVGPLGPVSPVGGAMQIDPNNDIPASMLPATVVTWELAVGAAPSGEYSVGLHSHVLTASDDTFLVAHDMDDVGQVGGLTIKVVDAQSPSCNEPVITAAVSRKTHGQAGTFDIDVLAGERENRTNGLTQLVVTFDQEVVESGSPAVTTSSGTVDNVTINANVVTIGMSGGDLHGLVTISFPGLADATGECPVTGTVNAHVKLGDVNNDGQVSTTDMVLVRNNMGQPVTSANFKADLNHDGQVSTTDMVTVRSNLGK